MLSTCGPTFGEADGLALIVAEPVARLVPVARTRELPGADLAAIARGHVADNLLAGRAKAISRLEYGAAAQLAAMAELSGRVVVQLAAVLVRVVDR